MTDFQKWIKLKENLVKVKNNLKRLNKEIDTENFVLELNQQCLDIFESNHDNKINLFQEKWKTRNADCEEEDDD